MKKTMITAIIFCILVMFSFYVYADETITKIDNEGDVLYSDYSDVEEIFTKVSDKPNIDITEIKYVSEGSTATVEVKVKGSIEDAGSSDILDTELLEGRTVSYYVYIETSESYYEIFYVNTNCTLSTDAASDEITCNKIGANDNTLQFIFSLQGENEQLIDINVIAGEEMLDFQDLENPEYYSYNDYYPELPVDFTIDVADEGETGRTIEFSSEIYYGVSPFKYKWDFGDGSASTEEEPHHKYSKPGTYTVNLTITDGVGSTGYSTDEIEITGEPVDSSEGSPVLLFFIIIILIVIIGIGIIVYLVRR